MEKALLDIAEQLKTIEYLDDKALTKVINRNNKRILEEGRARAAAEEGRARTATTADAGSTEESRARTATAGNTPPGPPPCPQPYAYQR